MWCTGFSGHVTLDASTMTAWGRRSAPPYAHSLVAPFPAGVPEPRPRITRDLAQGCTREHFDARRCAKFALRLMQRFVTEGITPGEAARAANLSHRPLLDLLSGRRAMSGDLEDKWRLACSPLPPLADCNPCHYYWHGKIHEWPRLPRTVAAEEALFIYPAYIADIALTQRWRRDESCFCRVLAVDEQLYTLRRTRSGLFPGIVGPGTIRDVVPERELRRSENQRTGSFGTKIVDPTGMVERLIAHDLDWRPPSPTSPSSAAR